MIRDHSSVVTIVGVAFNTVLKQCHFDQSANFKGEIFCGLEANCEIHETPQSEKTTKWYSNKASSHYTLLLTFTSLAHTNNRRYGLFINSNC